mgnify:CR=1 FL=1
MAHFRVVFALRVDVVADRLHVLDRRASHIRDVHFICCGARSANDHMPKQTSLQRLWRQVIDRGHEVRFEQVDFRYQRLCVQVKG